MKKRTTLLIGLVSITAATFIGIARAEDPLGDDTFRIVSPQWLTANLTEEDLIILDVRQNVRDYQVGHIPGAIYFPEGLVRSPSGGMPVQYTPPEIVEKLFGRAGIQDDNDMVVVYSDGEDVLGAGMVAYALLRAGHDNVALLDGGYSGYQAVYPVTQDYPDIEPADYEAELDESRFITLDELKDEMEDEFDEDDPELKLIDIRPLQAYADTDRWTRSGHIPGSVNSDWHPLVERNNPHKFRPVEQMRAAIERTGVEENDDIVFYCNTSREAALPYLLTKHVLGYPDVRLYEGSWVEYSVTPDLPVQMGPAPQSFED